MNFQDLPLHSAGEHSTTSSSVPYLLPPGQLSESTQNRYLALLHSFLQFSAHLVQPTHWLQPLITEIRFKICWRANLSDFEISNKKQRLKTCAELLFFPDKCPGDFFLFKLYRAQMKFWRNLLNLLAACFFPFSSTCSHWYLRFNFMISQSDISPPPSGALGSYFDSMVFPDTDFFRKEVLPYCIIERKSYGVPA